jgi:hypothetical protein
MTDKGRTEFFKNKKINDSFLRARFKCLVGCLLPDGLKVRVPRQDSILILPYWSSVQIIEDLPRDVREIQLKQCERLMDYELYTISVEKLRFHDLPDGDRSRIRNDFMVTVRGREQQMRHSKPAVSSVDTAPVLQD